MSRNNRSLAIRLFVLVVSIAFFGDLYVSAQNTNSSTTMDPNMSMQNTNSSTTYPNRRRRRRRRGRRYPAASTPTTPPACGPMDAGTPTGPAAPTTPVRYGRCDPNAQEQTDLSGTYTGTVNYSEGGMTGDATLTITGNDFTMTAGSSTQEGRVVAVTTCNYTAVTMMFGKSQTTAQYGSQPPPLTAVSLRAKRTGKGIALTSVAGEKRQFSFMSGGGGGSGKGTGYRSRRKRRAYAIKPPTIVGDVPN